MEKLDLAQVKRRWRRWKRFAEYDASTAFIERELVLGKRDGAKRLQVVLAASCAKRLAKSKHLCSS